LLTEIESHTSFFRQPFIVVEKKEVNPLSLAGKHFPEMNQALNAAGQALAFMPFIRGWLMRG
jgi:hypothetical protein